MILCVCGNYIYTHVSGLLVNGHLVKLPGSKFKADQRRWRCPTGGERALGIFLLQEVGSLWGGRMDS